MPPGALAAGATRANLTARPDSVPLHDEPTAIGSAALSHVVAAVTEIGGIPQIRVPAAGS